MAATPDVHLAVLGDGELRHITGGPRRPTSGSQIAPISPGGGTTSLTALADLDVVVLSSRNEGTPVALIEALAPDRPVVATDVGGVRHVVQDSRPDGCARRATLLLWLHFLQRACQPSTWRSVLAEEGRRRVAERFGRARMVADHVALYRELVAPKQRG